jgi:hypothetical protein
MFGGIREVVKGEGGGGEIRHTKGRTRRRSAKTPKGRSRRMISPFAKLGALMIKTLGKPVATWMKVEAAKHPWFRQLIINFAQVKHFLCIL